MNVLIFAAFYLPGFKGGGPIRTIANMLDRLGNEYCFYLVVLDRDLGDTTSYSGIQADRWQGLHNAHLYYASPSGSWLYKIWMIIWNFQGNVLYLNSFFSFRFSILPLLAWKIIKPGKSVVLGPRGEFSEGALALKSRKKRAFIALVKILGIYRHVTWYASSEYEKADIHKVFGAGAKVQITLNISCPPVDLTIQPRGLDAPLRLVFVSRISPKKNLLGAIQMLHAVSCPVVLDVYGPAEDAAYWARCQSAIKNLPSNVHFHYGGPLYPAQVPEVMGRHDLFFFPTMGENFGHVIAEALGCGLPVLIADTTPWRDLMNRKLGWDIPLNQPEKFVAAIEACSRMTAADYDSWRHSIRAWALANIGSDEAVDQHRQLFMNLDTTHEH